MIMSNYLRLKAVFIPLSGMKNLNCFLSGNKKEWNIKWCSNSGWIVKFTYVFSLYWFSFKKNPTFPWHMLIPFLVHDRIPLLFETGNDGVPGSIHSLWSDFIFYLSFFSFFFFYRLHLFDRYWHFWPRSKRKEITTAPLTSQKTWILSQILTFVALGSYAKSDALFKVLYNWEVLS